MSDLDETEVTRTGVAAEEGKNGEFTAGDVIGRFSIVGEIGRGGMGRIYEAQDPNLQRRVAIKVLHGHGSETHRQRLIREAQALARLDHPNVITVHEVGSHQGLLFIAMELVKGGTLKDWLAENPPGERDRQTEAMRLLADAGRGLLAAHGEGLIHRDIKPSNILIGADGRPRVADFGIVRSVRESSPEYDVTAAEVNPMSELVDSRSGTLTRSGASVGTPAYMAPEQFGGGEVGEAADVFSFCVMAWELLFGERPFQGKTVGELMGSVRKGVSPPADPGLVPTALSGVLLEGLKFRPRERPRTLGALVEQLDAIVRTGKPIPRTRRAWLVGAGAIVASVAVVATYAVAYDDPCGQGVERFSATWNDQRAEWVAVRAADGLVSELDAYASDWASAYDDACELALVRGEQTVEQMAERHACLELERHAVADMLNEVVGGARENGGELDASWAPSNCAHGFGIAIPLPDAEQEALDSARTARSESRFEVAIERLDRLEELGALTPGAEARAAFERGVSLTGLGKIEEGVAHLERAFELSTAQGNDYLGFDSASRLAQWTGEPSRSWLEEARKLRDPESPGQARVFCLSEFLVSANTGTTEELLAVAERSLSADSPCSNDVPSLVRVAVGLVNEGVSLDRTLEVLDRVDDLGGSDGERYSARSIRCRALGEAGDSRAAAVCTEAIRLEPMDVEALTGALIFCERRSHDECAHVLVAAQAALSETSMPAGHFMRLSSSVGSYLAEIGRVDEGLEYARDSCPRATAQGADRTVATCVGFVKMLAAAGRHDEALVEARLVERALADVHAINRLVVVAHLDLAYVFVALGHRREGLEHARIAAEFSSGSADEMVKAAAQNNYCASAVQTLTAEEALVICENASRTARNPAAPLTNVHVEINLGASYFELGRFEEAVAAYRRAIEQLASLSTPEPSLVVVLHANLGEALEALGRWEESVSEYRDAFSRCNAGWSAYHFAGTGLVRVLAKTGDFGAAQSVLGEMQKSTPATEVASRAKLAEAAGFLAQEQRKPRAAAKSYVRAVDLFATAGSSEDVARLCAQIDPRPGTCPQ